MSTIHTETTATNREVHPMVRVPDAIRTVMRETAEILLSNQKANPTVRVPLLSTQWQDLLGCVLDEDVLMKEPGYPPYNASIMDGYAVSTTDFSIEDAKIASTNNPTSWTHRVVDRIYAGDASTRAVVEEGDAKDNLPSTCYITTGAVVPDCYDCVVPVEECEVSPSTSTIRIAPTATLQPKKWIRPVGCDILATTVVLPKGHTMDPVAIGLAKQSGADHIVVKRRIKVGVLSTGNELIGDSTNDDDSARDGTAPIKMGKIPDVNRPVLLAMLSSSTFRNTCEPMDLGTVGDDDTEVMVATVESALDRCDIIVTTGGISMGELDIVERVLVDRCGGNLHFGRMHMKPGKPTTFVTVPRQVDGRTAIKMVFAQPGNPCSAAVCTQLLVGPCLDLYFHGIDHEAFEAGDKTKEEQLDEIVNASFVHPEIEARLTHDIKLDAKRPEYHRVILTKRIGGSGQSFDALSTGVQRSSRLMSLRDAQGLMLLPQSKGGKIVACQGEIYPVLLMNNAFAKEPVRMRDSIHLKREKRKVIKVGVIEVLPFENPKCLASKLDRTCDETYEALNEPKSAIEFVVVSKRTFSEPLDKLNSFVMEEAFVDADLIVVSCVKFDGSFQYHLNVSKLLRQRLSKVANSLSLQARMGAASQDPLTSLFETTVGYVPNKNGAMLVCVPESGVMGALGNIRSLIVHGLKLARANN